MYSGTILNRGVPPPCLYMYISLINASPTPHLVRMLWGFSSVLHIQEKEKRAGDSCHFDMHRLPAGAHGRPFVLPCSLDKDDLLLLTQKCQMGPRVRAHGCSWASS